MDERSCHVEDDECPNPREEQNQREGKKYKPHEQTPLWPAIISLFGESICSRGPTATFRGNLSGFGIQICQLCYDSATALSHRLEANMPDEEWIKTLDDGRKVKFFYQELAEDGAFITAQLAGNEVVYSIILTKARNPLSREDVESRFKGELSKK